MGKTLHKTTVAAATRTLAVGALAVTAGLFAGGATAQQGAGQVNVYSYRQEALIRPLLDEFTRQTGITVNLVSGEADVLLERLKSEGANSPADVLMTTDAGRLIRAEEAGVLQPVTTERLSSLVPAQYRDPEGHWYGLSVRARPIFYAKDRVAPTELSTYEDLADPKWKGRVCVRSSSNIYNQSMLAAMIAHVGPEKTEQWAKGLVANFARKPQGGDRDQLKALAAGECDVAIANTYYYAGLAKSDKPDERLVAEKVGVLWPNQDGRGAHVNISGAGVTKSAKHKAEAVRLIEFLASNDAQKLYAEVVNEYPLRSETPVDPIVKAMGSFKADTLSLDKLAENNAEAVRIADRAGWR